jgi:hypothetical protein
MAQYPKRIKRLLRDWLTVAYERELHRELTKLDRSFEEWRQGQIGSGELSHRIHQYDTGPSRELYRRYNYGEQDMSVAYAIVIGILNRDEVPPDLLQALERLVEFYQSMKDRDELRLPDDS